MIHVFYDSFVFRKNVWLRVVQQHEDGMYLKHPEQLLLILVEPKFIHDIKCLLAALKVMKQ